MYYKHWWNNYWNFISLTTFHWYNNSDFQQYNMNLNMLSHFPQIMKCINNPNGYHFQNFTLFCNKIIQQLKHTEAFIKSDANWNFISRSHATLLTCNLARKSIISHFESLYYSLTFSHFYWFTYCISLSKCPWVPSDDFLKVVGGPLHEH